MKLTDITTEDLTTLVGLLTEVQKDELVGVYYAPDSIYNPIQDIDDNWVISVEEMEHTTNPDTMWVKDLELIEYKPKPTPSPF
jgi:predicted DNA-binding transcriptional regulator